MVIRELTFYKSLCLKLETFWYKKCDFLYECLGVFCLDACKACLGCLSCIASEAMSVSDV
jgi:hypothetical protein